MNRSLRLFNEKGEMHEEKKTLSKKDLINMDEERRKSSYAFNEHQAHTSQPNVKGASPQVWKETKTSLQRP